MLLRRYHNTVVQKVETPSDNTVVKEKKEAGGKKNVRKSNTKTASTRV